MREEQTTSNPERPRPDNAVSQVDIMVRANKNWAAAGMPKGGANRFWFEAEEELRQEAAKAVSDRPSAEKSLEPLQSSRPLVPNEVVNTWFLRRFLGQAFNGRKVQPT